jgi:hypothetical protein
MVVVGASVGVSAAGGSGVLLRGMMGVAVALSTTAVSTGGGVGVGVGLGAKLPHANVGPSQISDAAKSARNCHFRLSLLRLE